MLPFRSDFRGFVFEDSNLGVRFFGNADNNKWQYNLALFDQLDKDTNSGLVRYEDRNQNVLIANVYRQDWPVVGYTSSLSFHWNRDRRATEFDDNGFLVAPAPIGNFTPTHLDAYYLGWAGEGHFGDRLGRQVAQMGDGDEETCVAEQGHGCNRRGGHGTDGRAP